MVGELCFFASTKNFQEDACKSSIILPDVTVTGEEFPTQAEAPKTRVEVPEGVFWQRGHRVAVQGQKGEVGDATESLNREDADHVEP